MIVHCTHAKKHVKQLDSGCAHGKSGVLFNFWFLDFDFEQF